MSVNTIQGTRSSSLLQNFKDNVQMIKTSSKTEKLTQAAFGLTILFIVGAATASCFLAAPGLASPLLTTITQVAAGTLAAACLVGAPALSLLAPASWAKAEGSQEKHRQEDQKLRELPTTTTPGPIRTKVPVQLQNKPQSRTLAQIAYDNRYLILAGVVVTAATIAGVKLGREGIAKLPGQAKDFVVDLPTKAKNFGTGALEAGKKVPGQAKELISGLPTKAKNFGTGALEAGKKVPGQAKDFVVGLPTKAKNLGTGALEVGKKVPGQAKDFVVDLSTKAKNLGTGALEVGKKVPGQAKELIVGLPTKAKNFGTGALEAGKKVPGQAKDFVVGLPGNALAFGKTILSKVSFKK